MATQPIDEITPILDSVDGDDRVIVIVDPGGTPSDGLAATSTLATSGRGAACNRCCVD